MSSIVSLQGVSKRYRIFPSQRDQLKRILSLGRYKVGREFWALQDINLELDPGAALGIVGRNGAGKTTLLKIVSGVLQPTSGTARVNGRLVALLSLGAGFNDEFTGRENIMLNGLILGIERKEMLKRVDEIEAFAEIGEFVDQPLKTYSSGMRARLGFSVAVNVDPDILLVDEALATGDALFKAKGIQKMRDLLTSGATVLFVSHSKAQVNEFCNEAILLHKGRLMSRGDTDQVMDEYKNLLVNESTKQENQLDLEVVPSDKVTQGGGDELQTPEFKGNLTVHNKEVRLRPGTGEARIQHVELLDDHDRPVDMVILDSNLTVRAHVQYMEDVDDSVVDLAIRNKSGIDIFSTSTSLKETPIGSRRAGEQVIVDFTFGVPLQQGNYSVHASIRHPKRKGKPLDWIDVAAVFKVLHPSTKGGFKGMVNLPTQVEIFEPNRVR